MTPPRNIIGIVKELQEAIDAYRKKPMVILEETNSATAHLAMRTSMYFPAIAAHILAQEEKLKEAIEMLEAYAACDGLCEKKRNGDCTCISTRGAKKALSRIRSHPTE